MDNQLPPRSSHFGTSETLASQVMSYVRDAVQEGRMTPENWYSVYQVAEQLGISRSPVREGLLRLEEAGLIEFVRNRGFRVVETKPEDVAEIFSLRLAIEPAAAARAAQAFSGQGQQSSDASELRAALQHMSEAVENNDEPLFFEWDQYLHNLILESGHYRRGAAFLKTLRTHTRLLSDSTVRSYRSLAQVHSEHLPIIDAITAGDAQDAYHAMSAHITATGKLLLRQTIAKRASEDKPLTTNELDEKVDNLWNAYVAEPAH